MQLGNIFNAAAMKMAQQAGFVTPNAVPPNQQPQGFNLTSLLNNPAQAIGMFNKAQQLDYGNIINNLADKHGIDKSKAQAFMQEFNMQVLNGIK